MTQAWRWVATSFGGPEVLEEVEVGLSDPSPGQVTIEVRAAGMNPADYKHFAPGQDPKLLPLTIGYEVAGVIAAIGADTVDAKSGRHAVIGNFDRLGCRMWGEDLKIRGDHGGIAVDPAGDLFELGNSAVTELTVGGATETLPMGPLASTPFGIAADAAGDAYVTNRYSTAFEVTAQGAQKLPFTGLEVLSAIAADPQGDVFVTDQEGDDVVELSPVLQSGSLAVSPGSGPRATSLKR